MKTNEPSCGMALGLVALLVIAIVGTGCPAQKPAALVWAEQFAQQLRGQAGCTNTLRQWFIEVQSVPHSKGAAKERVPVPRSLNSEWWRHARATAVYSEDGTLNRICVSRDVYEVITIGAASATPKDLGLTYGPGDCPVFPAKIADGMCAWLLYK